MSQENSDDPLEKGTKTEEDESWDDMSDALLPASGPSYIARLNDDCVMDVFAFLTTNEQLNLRLVSRQFGGIDAAVWTAIAVTVKEHRAAGAAVQAKEIAKGTATMVGGTVAAGASVIGTAVLVFAIGRAGARGDFTGLINLGVWLTAKSAGLAKRGFQQAKAAAAQAPECTAEFAEKVRQTILQERTWRPGDDFDFVDDARSLQRGTVVIPSTRDATLEDENCDTSLMTDEEKDLRRRNQAILQSLKERRREEERKRFASNEDLIIVVERQRYHPLRYSRPAGASSSIGWSPDHLTRWDPLPWDCPQLGLSCRSSSRCPISTIEDFEKICIDPTNKGEEVTATDNDAPAEIIVSRMLLTHQAEDDDGDPCVPVISTAEQAYKHLRSGWTWAEPNWRLFAADVWSLSRDGVAEAEESLKQFEPEFPLDLCERCGYKIIPLEDRKEDTLENTSSLGSTDDVKQQQRECKLRFQDQQKQLREKNEEENENIVPSDLERLIFEQTESLRPHDFRPQQHLRLIRQTVQTNTCQLSEFVGKEERTAFLLNSVVDQLLLKNSSFQTNEAEKSKTCQQTEALKTVTVWCTCEKQDPVLRQQREARQIQVAAAKRRRELCGFGVHANESELLPRCSGERYSERQGWRYGWSFKDWSRMGATEGPLDVCRQRLWCRKIRYIL